MKRRQFLTLSLTAGAGLYATGHLRAVEPTTTNKIGAPFRQPPLPFPGDAMKPFLSRDQLMYHYTKHQGANFTTLNKLVKDKPEAAMSLRELIVQSTGPVFNNAAQAWNHSFYWDCMSPNGGGEPKGDLASAIQRDFGSLATFQKAMSEAAVKLFGSGWAWLAADKEGKLEIMPLGNADTPLKHGKEPLLTIDVWEHAYYIDYRNERPKYIEAFWKAANWDFAAKCYAAVVK